MRYFSFSTSRGTGSLRISGNFLAAPGGISSFEVPSAFAESLSGGIVFAVQAPDQRQDIGEGASRSRFAGVLDSVSRGRASISFDVRRPTMKALISLTSVLAVLVFVTAAQADGRPLETSLTGAAEVPGPGDPDGSGEAFLALNQGQGEICFQLAVSDIAPATAAHIHRGPEGVAGPVVVGLAPPTSGFSSGCVSVDRDLVKEIRQNPSGFYVNVHNAPFPGGAIRGQLGK
jgi:hypothetical protein